MAEASPAPQSDEPLKKRVCSRVGCQAKATHLAVLLGRPPRSHGSGEFPLYLDLPLCPDHAACVSVKSILTPKIWELMKAYTKAMGWVEPCKGRSGTTTVLIDNAPPPFRRRYEPDPDNPAPPTPPPPTSTTPPSKGG